MDNVINSGGSKIFPEQLEALVKKEIPMKLFFRIDDESLGQKLILVIEGENQKI
jgi:O-succinylbenzoic acid--CoA ligase